MCKRKEFLRKAATRQQQQQQRRITTRVIPNEEEIPKIKDQDERTSVYR